MKIIPKIAAMLLLIILTFGCSKDMIINVDGMPISDHEYNLTNEETGIRAVFVLARYQREYEGKEYIIKPEYLDALHANRIDSDTTEQLTLHIKVINLRRKHFSVNWEIVQPKDGKIVGLLYAGKLSRKDFYMKLPTDKHGDYGFSFRVLDEDGDDLFSLPQLRYKVRGGAKARLDHK